MLDRLAATACRIGVLRQRPLAKPAEPGAPITSIVIVTYNRARMFERCLASVLGRSGDDVEVVIWDNASTDRTAEIADAAAARDPRVRVVHSGENVGLNGVARGVAIARGAYIIELDDDVLDVPEGWVDDLVSAFRAVPRAGYLAANVVQDDTTNGAKPPATEYRAVDYGRGVVIEHGPTGGWCTITSREVIGRIGNFMEIPGRIFFAEDGEFGRRCHRHLLRTGIVRDVRVYHATGIDANAAFGYLDVCELKYGDSEAFEPFLDAVREARRNDSAARPF